MSAFSEYLRSLDLIRRTQPMNGPDHFREAESMADTALQMEPDGPETRVWLACAQVHATLALAAATVEANSRSWEPTHAADKRWIDVIGPAPSITGRERR